MCALIHRYNDCVMYMRWSLLAEYFYYSVEQTTVIEENREKKMCRLAHI